MLLEELQVYQLSMTLSDQIWDKVTTWDYFTRDTIGKQLVRAADSISANISEGHGRYHYKENINFCYYSRGSLQETKTWITKALKRNLLSEEDYNSLYQQLNTLSVKLNNYIKSIGRSAQE